MPALPIWLWLVLGGAGVAVAASVLSGGGDDSVESEIKKEARAYKTPVIGALERFRYKPPANAVRPIGPECVRALGDGYVGKEELECSPPLVGAPFVIYTERATGIDVTGQPWMWLDNNPGSATLGADDEPRTWGWYPATFSDGSKDLIDYLDEYVPVVLEAAAVYVGSFFGGPAGGMAVKMAITAIKKIAKGASITKTLVDATSEAIKGQIEKTEFGLAYKQFAEHPYTRAQVAAARNAIVNQFSDSDTQDDVAKAIDDGVALARAKRVQDLTLYAMSQRMTAEHSAWLYRCVGLGASLRDWAYAYGGNPANDLLSRIISLCTEYVERGETGWLIPPDNSTPILDLLEFKPKT